MQSMTMRVAAILLLGALLTGCGNKDDAVSQAEKHDAAAGVPAPGIEEDIKT